MSAQTKQKIPLKNVFFLSIGLLVGFSIATALPLLSDSSTERVASFEEVAANHAVLSAAEEITSRPIPPEVLDSAVNKIQPPHFDGPAFAKSMPIDTKELWLNWMQAQKSEELDFLNQRWALAQEFITTKELKSEADVRAFLLTPREHFVRERNKGYEYADTWLPIGYGATITDPDVVSMMTSTLQIKPGDRVLEIGSGSGYQAAMLSSLTNQVYTIEIIKPLQAETEELLSSLTEHYPAFGNIKRKLGDGYYGWKEYAPFDKIIVTCSIDHIPPPLLRQLSPDGIMVLPLGPPGRQYIMEVKKKVLDDGSITLTRRDVYNGLGVRFIPFLDEKGTAYSDGE